MSDDTYMITTDEIEATAGTPKTHLINENAKRINKSFCYLAGLTGFGFHIIEVEPSHDSAEHYMHDAKKLPIPH